MGFKKHINLKIIIRNPYEPYSKIPRKYEFMNYFIKRSSLEKQCLLKYEF